MRLKLVSLCSGGGALDLAAGELWDTEVIAHAEKDAWASKVLARHWPEVPNLGDISQVDWERCVGCVDILTAGYPCQPFSKAGRRKGTDDDRHLWPQVHRAVCALRPGRVLLENVPGHRSLGFGRVLGDLAEAGYVGSWCSLRASDVGAPHRRERVFITAHPADAGSERLQGHGLRRGDGSILGLGWKGTDDQPAARDPGQSRTPALPFGGCLQRHGGTGDMVGASGGDEVEGLQLQRRGDATVDGDEVAPFGAYQPAVDRWAGVLGRSAPPGLLKDRGEDRKPRLNVRFTEWMMGLPEGWVTDVIPRRHGLRVLGNSVVPQQAAAAYRILLDRTGREAAFRRT